MLITSNQKVYEKPETNTYDAVLADVVDLGVVPGQFGAKPKVRLVWLLNALDSEGNNYQVMRQLNATMFVKSDLHKTVAEILGESNETVPETYDVETLIGRNNQLFIQKETAKTGKVYANIKAIMPAKVAIAIPQGFIRKKDEPKKVYGNNQAAPATAPAPVATAPAPAPAAPAQAAPLPAAPAPAKAAPLPAAPAPAQAAKAAVPAAPAVPAQQVADEDIPF